MNLSTAVFLINPDVRAILCIYEAETPTHKPPRIMFKTLDPSIKEGDLVIVPTATRHNMTINKVVAVDVAVNFEDMTPVHWIVDRVDPSAYERTLMMEEAAKAAITSADRRRRLGLVRFLVVITSTALALRKQTVPLRCAPWPD